MPSTCRGRHAGCSSPRPWWTGSNPGGRVAHRLNSETLGKIVEVRASKDGNFHLVLVRWLKPISIAYALRKNP
jgi:hypothetical protein